MRDAGFDGLHNSEALGKGWAAAGISEHLCLAFPKRSSIYTHHFAMHTHHFADLTHHCLMRIAATGSRLTSKRATFRWEMVHLGCRLDRIQLYQYPQPSPQTSTPTAHLYAHSHLHYRDLAIVPWCCGPCARASGGAEKHPFRAHLRCGPLDPHVHNLHTAYRVFVAVSLSLFLSYLLSSLPRLAWIAADLAM